MDLSVVFSFRNEERNLEELVERVSKAIISINVNTHSENKNIGHELIFVNDDSTDGSLSLLRMLQKKYPITIINTSRRFGVCSCILAGLEQAKGNAIIYMDSDLQDPPELIPALYKEYLNGSEVVHTRRIKRLGEPWYKMFLTSIAYKLINGFSALHLPENVGDFKLLSNRVVHEILKIGDYEPYMRGLSIWVGFNQKTIDYIRLARNSGKSGFPIFRSKGPAKEFINGIISYSNVLLYMPIIFGILSVFASISITVFAIVTKLMGISSPGVSSTLIVISFFGGLILVSNGIIGIYIGKIYNQSRKYPRYIVKNIYERNSSDL
jgi:glycosyltransferase involved in cell wall biosynthesis